MALDDNAIPDDEVAAAFHKNRPPFSGLGVWVKTEDDPWTRDIDKTPDDGI
jgi:hypothetical protein